MVRGGGQGSAAAGELSRRLGEEYSINPIVMAGLGPAIHACDIFRMAGGWIYIMTNRPNGTLYVGVTSDLPRRT